MEYEQEWIKELWEDFTEVPIKNDETREQFFIWKRGTEVEEIIDWFKEQSENEYPPKKFELNEVYECEDCGREKCVCDCEHEDVDEDGYCEICGDNLRERCDHYSIDTETGYCDYCRVNYREQCEHTSMVGDECERCGLEIIDEEEENENDTTTRCRNCNTPITERNIEVTRNRIGCQACLT